MRLAIIGGGAAGMATAYLLHEAHDITVFEKQPMLGGNIRTLNRNVQGTGLRQDRTLENGVIEFLQADGSYFEALMADLGVKLAYVRSVSTQLFRLDCSYLQAPGVIRDSNLHPVTRIGRYGKLLRLAIPQWQLDRKIKNTESWKGHPVSNLLDSDTLGIWYKMLLMYSYSIPYAEIDNLPAELALMILNSVAVGTRWNRIVGGVYTYIERILACFTGTVHCDVTINAIKRQNDRVSIRLHDDTTHDFDAVIFATPPDQVLQLLGDADDDEIRRFGGWKANHAVTVVHTDMQMYDPYGHPHYSAFDVFEKTGGTDAGYNAYLNDLCGIDDKRVAYSMAYNMHDQIDPQTIIHHQQHHTPRYTVDAFTYRDEVIATNGHNRIYHAGAYLSDGLHNGAIESANRVSVLLGGKDLRVNNP